MVEGKEKFKNHLLETTKIMYLIPINIRAPLIFAHLACAKIKESKFAQYQNAKIKGGKCHEWMKKRQIYSKISLREYLRGAKSEGALKLEARRLKGRNLVWW